MTNNCKEKTIHFLPKCLQVDEVSRSPGRIFNQFDSTSSLLNNMYNYIFL